jgi:hypothetical protein
VTGYDALLPGQALSNSLALRKNLAMTTLKKKTYAIVMALSLATLTSCGTPSAEDLAAREVESDSALWDEEDYKSVAAKGCIEYKVIFNLSLGSLYADWETQYPYWYEVTKTVTNLNDHPTYDPLYEIVSDMMMNSVQRASGMEGWDIDTAAGVTASEICSNLGVELSE